MRILLILPANEECRVMDRRSPVPRRKYLRFSLLPLTIVAALTPPEYEVRIIDENVEYLDLSCPADLVGITFMTALAPRAYQIASAFRRRGIPVVAGGYHPTFCPDEATLYVDAVVVGEAELHWKQVLADWQTGSLKRIYSSPRPCRSQDIPVPRRDLTQHTAHQYVTINAVQTGRGCRNTCRYCSITTFHRNAHRSRPLAHVLAELKGLPRDIMFIDDNIIAHREYARELFRRMIPLRKRWVGQCSIDVADEREMLTLLRQSGCIGLFIGIESVNEQNLGAYDKSFNNPASYEKRLATIHRTGLLVFASMIVGGDSDTVQVFPDTLRFLRRVSADGLQLNILTPLPGTPLYQQYQHAGRLTDFDWGHYDFRHVVIEPELMTRAELQRGADWLYLQFYRLDRIFLRSLRILIRGGWVQAFITLRLGLTYRYDNRREQLSRRFRNLRQASVPAESENSVVPIRDAETVS